MTLQKQLKILLLAGMFFVGMRAHAAMIINEIMYDLPAADDGREWIEITNTGSDPVDMTGWKLFENNTSHAMALNEGDTVIAPNGFAIIADNPQKFLLDWPDFSGTLFDSAFSLSNSGEEIALKDPSGTVIDSILFDVSLGAGGDGNSLQRMADTWTAQLPTPNNSNGPSVDSSDSTVPPENDDVSVDTSSDTSLDTSNDGTLSDDTQENDDASEEDITPDQIGDDSDESQLSDNSNADDETSQTIDVVINEIMYDAIGADTGHEWIEIFNRGIQSVDLAGWKVSESGTNHRVVITQGNTTIAGGSFAIIANNATVFIADHPDFSGIVFESAFSLSNSGEEIVLLDADSMERDRVVYDASLGAAGDGASLQKIDDNFIAGLPTAGAVNTIIPFLLPNSTADRSLSNSVSSLSDTAPALIESIPPIDTTNETIPVLELNNDANASNPDFSMVTFSLVKREKNYFLKLENQSDVFIDISNIAVESKDKTFLLSAHTIISDNASIVIAGTDKQFANATRAFWSGEMIVIE